PSKISRAIWQFFFSSRRRHTRSDRDWSSDVCSSDLGELVSHQNHGDALAADQTLQARQECLYFWWRERGGGLIEDQDSCTAVERSEERRVGKECRSRLGACGGKDEE